MKSKEIRGAARVLCAALLLPVVCGAVARAQEGAGWVGARQGQAGRDLNAVYFADSKRGWAAGDGGLVLHTEDGGRTWSRQNIGTDENVDDVYFRDREDGYLLAVNQIFTTEDGGQTWKLSARFPARDFGGAAAELYSVRFTGKKRGWIVGSLSRGDTVVDSLVLRTADGGATWQRQRVPFPEELIHLDFHGDKRGWIVGSRGRILHTSDGGETWQLQNSGTKVTLYHVDFQGGERGWAVGERGTILLTEDGGATWRVTAAPVRSTLLTVAFASKDEGWIAGRGGVILRSGDGGQTWVQQETNTRQNLYALFFDKKTGWAVGGDGMVLRYER